MAFLGTNDKWTEETKNQKPKTKNQNQGNSTFHKSLKKYLGITLTKQVRDLYSKNLKTMKKETEEDTRRWKDLPSSWIGSFTKINIQIQCNFHQNFTQFFTEI